MILKIDKMEGQSLSLSRRNVREERKRNLRTPKGAVPFARMGIRSESFL